MNWALNFVVGLSFQSLKSFHIFKVPPFNSILANPAAPSISPAKTVMHDIWLYRTQHGFSFLILQYCLMDNARDIPEERDAGANVASLKAPAYTTSRCCDKLGEWSSPGVLEFSGQSIYLRLCSLPLHFYISFTFSHLADAFIQSNLHMWPLQCIHILHLHWWHTAHQEQLGVQCLA